LCVRLRFSRFNHARFDVRFTGSGDASVRIDLAPERRMRHPTDWPLRQHDPWRWQQDPVAPLRPDLALARYLETQAAHREANRRRFDPVASAK